MEASILSVSVAFGFRNKVVVALETRAILLFRNAISISFVHVRRVFLSFAGLIPVKPLRSPGPTYSKRAIKMGTGMALKEYIVFPIQSLVEYRVSTESLCFVLPLLPSRRPYVREFLKGVFSCPVIRR